MIRIRFTERYGGHFAVLAAFLTLTDADRPTSEFLRSFGLLISTLRRFACFSRMVIRYLCVLGRVRVLALFMRFRGLSVRFGSIFVVSSRLVVVVFWHFVSCYR